MNAFVSFLTACRRPLAAVALLASLALHADGFIVVPDPGPLPAPWPHRPHPMPLPPPHYTFAPLEVVFHHVEVRIRDQVAVTAVDQEFYNPNDRQLEGTYLFPVPPGAQIDQFSMDVDGQQVAAELLAADKARQIYEDIVRKHRDPALLEYVGREVFKVRIFPIEPRSRKHIKLSYTQVLRADAGLVGYTYPLNTEKFSAKPIPDLALKLDLETRLPLKSIYSPSHAVEIHRHGDRQATVGFEARNVKPDTDFQVFFAPEAGSVGLNLMTFKPAGEDGYFLLLAAPAFETRGEPVVPKDVAFVLDTSGSMAGKKLEQAKKALTFCVENLNDADRFEIIRFSTDVEPLFNRLAEASRSNRDRANAFVSALKPAGGTAIFDALKQTLALRPVSAGDGTPRTADGSAAANRPFLVIFLTDGLPTVGETDNDRIVANAKKASRGAARVFCFGIGTDVNTHLLDRITESTHAASAYVLPEEDLELKVSSFFAKVKDPVLSNLTLSFPAGIRATQLLPSPLPDLFKGEQLVLVGRYAGEGSGPLTLQGAAGGRTQTFAFDARFGGGGGGNDFIPRLWATRRVGYLLDEIRLHGENAELKDEVITLARKYAIVTPYTAFLIHEDEARRNVPLASQSISLFATNALAREAGQSAYSAFQRDVSGQGAVAAARYGLAQKSANQVSLALDQARVEAGRAFVAAAPAQMAAPATAGAAASGLATTPPVGGGDTASRVSQLSQQSRFVGGRTFFQNGARWVDGLVQQQGTTRTLRVEFNSTEYFDLMAKRPEVRSWLALGPSVQFVLGDALYDVYE